LPDFLHPKSPATRAKSGAQKIRNPDFMRFEPDAKKVAAETFFSHKGDCNAMIFNNILFAF
jgi:hypothetical protein